MARGTFEKVGGYDERYPGIPEDMLFFYKHLRLGGGLFKVDRTLQLYRYHQTSTSGGIHRHTLLQTRARELEETVLKHWKRFSIWGAGRDGKKLFMSFSDNSIRDKVTAFADVDKNKINSFYVDIHSNRKIPIIHYQKIRSPFITWYLSESCYADDTQRCFG